MNTEAIRLLPAVRRAADLFSDTVARGLRALLHQFGPPAQLWRSNQAMLPGLRYALVKLRRLHRILRYVFVIFAVVLVDVKPTRPPYPRITSSPRRAEIDGDPATWRMAFGFGAPHRGLRDDKGHRPAHLAHATRQPLRTLARQMEGLRRALADPMRHVRHLARLLRREVVYISRRFARRLPKLAWRHYFEELQMAREQASWSLRGFNTS